MHTSTPTVQTLFEGDHQFLIPLFQRRYVWETQWRPLWADIVAKARKCESDSQKQKPHFTGAIVIQHKSMSPGALPVYEIIDGQQRLTTFQVILCAFRGVCREEAGGDDAERFAVMREEVNRLLLNTSMRAQKQEGGKYKLMPTKFDREAMSWLIDHNSEIAPKGLLIDAYWYFHAKIKAFIGGDAEKAENLLTTIREGFGFVEILIVDDEPEIIFESLNARRVPLQEFDLLRNYLFLRARQSEGDDRDELYKKYWEHFETDQWNATVTVAKKTMPLSELFLQHFLTAQLATEKVQPLFQTYREEYSKALPDGCQTRDELRVLHGYSQKYLSLMSHDSDDGRAMQIYRHLDITSFRPFFLYLLAEANVSGEKRKRIFHALQSYTVRRLLCTKQGQKNFNKFFPEVIMKLRSDGGFSEIKLLRLLSMQESNTRKWPQDRDVRNAFGGQWYNGNIVRYFLYRAECQMREANPRTEDDTLNFSGLTLEHILPQSWEDTWHLPSELASDNGGVLLRDIYAEDYKQNHPDWWDVIPNDGFKDASYARAHQRAMDRYGALQSIGNLTLLKQSLNSSVSNAPFAEKKQKMGENSRLFLNKDVCRDGDWDVDQIRKREKRLCDTFCKIWPNAEWFLERASSDGDD